MAVRGSSGIPGRRVEILYLKRGFEDYHDKSKTLKTTNYDDTGAPNLQMSMTNGVGGASSAQPSAASGVAPLPPNGDGGASGRRGSARGADGEDDDDADARARDRSRSTRRGKGAGATRKTPKPTKKAPKTLTAEQEAKKQTAKDHNLLIMSGVKLKERMQKAVVSSADFLQAVHSQPEYSWAKGLLDPVRLARENMDRLKSKESFWRDWALQDDWKNWVRKHYEWDIIARKMKASAKEIEASIAKLEVEVATLKNMHNGRIGENSTAPASGSSGKKSASKRGRGTEQ